MKNLVCAALLFSVMLLAACATPTAKLNRTDAEQLKGKGITLAVSPAGSPASNLDGAWVFGALGQAAQGSTMQNKLQLVDPALKVEKNLKSMFAEKFNTTAGSEYKLTLKTIYWWIGMPIGAKDYNIVTAAIIEMKLLNSAGEIIASDTFNGTNDGVRTPIRSDDIKSGNVEKVNAALADVAEKATARFISTLSI